MNDSYYKGFPDPTASAENKETDEYGLDYARAVWAYYTRNSTRWDDQREQLIINRKYAEGLESTQKYKNRMDLEDSSYLNLDFTPINRIATLVDNMVGKLMNQTYKIQCNPIDAESLTQYDDYRRQLYANMYLAKIAPEMEEKTGIPLIPMGQKIPKNQDDAEMHLKLNYKMDASMAMEECVEWIDDQNMFPETRRKILRDLITIKKAALYRYYDHNHNIIHEYVDPVDIITPYSKHDDYRNITYVAVHKQYQIWELAEMNPEFTNEDLYNIAMQQAGSNRNPRWTYGTSYEGYYQSNNADFSYVNFNVNVLEFHFIAENTDTRVKRKNAKGGHFFDKKPAGYKIDVKPSSIVVVSDGDQWKVKGEKLTVKKSKAKTASDAQKHFAKAKTKRREETTEIINNQKKFLYSGKWIPGTDYIWSYGMSENIPRDKISGSYSPEVKLPISIIQPNMYDMQNKSLVERCIPLRME